MLAPSVGMVHAKIVKGGPPAASLIEGLTKKVNKFGHKKYHGPEQKEHRGNVEF